uniref:Methyl-accepting chemotaxis sensory transducer n=1 Tax=Rhodopseudomonas palustris (strain BisA53) TaxID=316055 RepID=Q07JN0_RHOP5
MSKLNRIGNKLGLASAVGILLSIGMVLNQNSTQSSVSEVNQRVDRQQQMSEAALKAESEMRNMQLAVRAVRLARTPAEVDKGRKDFKTAQAAQEALLDQNLALAIQPATKELFGKIKDGTKAYGVGFNEQAMLMQKVLDLNSKRSQIANDWNAQVGRLLGSPAIVGSEAERHLREADAAHDAISAAGWRFFVTGETNLWDDIRRSAETGADELAKAAKLADDPALTSGIDALKPQLQALVTATGEAITADDAKTAVSKTKTVPIANQVAKQLRESVEMLQKSVASAKTDANDTMAWAARIGFGFGAAIIVVLIGSALFSFAGIARPMTRLNAAMGKMASGDLAVVIPGASRGDEIGDIAKTIAVIRDNAEAKARAEAEAMRHQESLAAGQRQRDMNQLADRFEGAIGEIVETVSSASTELEASASTLTSTAVRSQQLATVVAAASEEASTNVQAVASATEEMSSSVNEISRQVQDSARIAGEAVDQARKTNDRVGELAKAASRIGDVVELINTIAGQTNLLALNATIEAARAGEAGRGFAVVASEVKALAEQTAKATGEIGQQIAGIQTATQDSVDAIKEISDTISKMSEIASTIASAVEEQGAATQEISRNVQQAAQGTQQVSSNIADVQRGAAETGSASGQVLSAAQTLSRDSTRLNDEVSKFLRSVRSA